MLMRIPFGRGMSLNVPFVNPVYAFTPIFILVLAPPLAIFGTITTTIAFTLMFLRGAVVLVQIAAVIVGSWILPQPLEPPKSVRRSPPEVSPNSSPRSRRRAPTLMTSPALSEESIESSGGARLQAVSTPSTTNDMGRDYEGVGGWRTAGDDDEEALWMNMNSRLQLPLESHTLRHQRSLTTGNSPLRQRAPSPEAARQSPVHSRARTPVRFALDEAQSYFPSHCDPTLRPLSSVSESAKHHSRRKSGSGSSSSSTVHGIPTSAREPGT